MNNKTLPSYDDYLELRRQNTKLKEALKRINIEIRKPTSLIDAQLLLGSVEAECNMALAEIELTTKDEA